MNAKSEAFFHSVHDKMKEADMAIKNNMTVMAESQCVRSESVETSQGNTQNTSKSSGARKSTLGTGIRRVIINSIFIVPQCTGIYSIAIY